MTEKLRADALRNRERVLATAEALFAAEGLDVQMDDIARRAGVGVGTLYRHFPTKDALFQAIVVRRIERVAAEAKALATAPAPGPAFFGFLERLVAEGIAKKEFVDALGETGVDVAKATEDVKAKFKRSLARLLARAQAAGAVREDVSAAEVLALIAGVHAAAQRLKNRRRLLDVVCDGLRAPSR